MKNALHSFKCALRTTLSRSPNGGKHFIRAVQDGYRSFTGNALSQSKASALAAAITDTMTPQVLASLGGESDRLKRLDAIFEMLSGICSRQDDYVYDDNFLDFFMPIARCHDEAGYVITLGIFTSIERRNDDKTLFITQSIKAEHGYHEEYSDVIITQEGRHIESALLDINDLWLPSCVLTNTMEALSSSSVKDCRTFSEQWALNTLKKRSNKANMASLVMCVATDEMRRITDVIGRPFDMNMAHTGADNSLFRGEINYSDL
jgi:hypothetical protein